MPFDKLNTILTALVSPLVPLQSSTRSPSSSSDLASSSGQTYSCNGQRKPIRLSASLQDFSRLDSEIGDHSREGFNRIYANNKKLRNELLRDSAGGASFSKEKGTSMIGLLTYKRKWVRALILVCFFILFSVASTCFLFSGGYFSRVKSNYNVIMDCGSTGTRVYVYEWSMNSMKGNSGLPITIWSLPKGGQDTKNTVKNGRAYNRMETEPGFDKLVRNEIALRKAIQLLLRWAEKQIPKHAHKTTSVYLYATAGVRRLPTSDSDWLLDKAWEILKGSKFSCKRDWVKTISGMEEAYYGWIALNSHMNILGSVPAKETYGSLDLGGSSLQVTFETKDPLHDKTSLKLNIGKFQHYLSAYSLSGYGLNDAFDKSVVHLIRQHRRKDIEELKSGGMVLKHPCLHTGYRQQYICTQCSALDKEGGRFLVKDKSAKKGRRGFIVQLIGDPNWEECNDLAKVAVNLSEWSDSSPVINCDIQPCALIGDLPQPRGKFYAMSGFFVAFKFFNLTYDASSDDLLQKGQEFCEKTWEVAKSSVVPQPFIEQYCFRAPYVASLLRDGLHIRDSNVVIGSGSITWTLGVALFEAGKALQSKMLFPWHGMLPRKMKTLIFIMILPLPLVVFCAISFAGKWLRRSFRRANLPLFRHNSVSSGCVHSFSFPFKLRWGSGDSGK